MAKRNRKDDEKRRRTCGTMDEHRHLAYLYPEYRRRRREIELETRQFIARYAAEGLRTGVVRIPVVVHVVWNTAAQNVSDAQIQSQLAVLNADFRRTNADAGSVPTSFAGVAADTRIEFALAVRDPNCGVTTGITRTNTATTGFTWATRNNIKSAAAGGSDPWPSDRYLNIWVANFTDNTLGFATFPGSSSALDGFVVDTEAFGTLGTATSPFNLAARARMKSVTGSTCFTSGVTTPRSPISAVGPTNAPTRLTKPMRPTETLQVSESPAVTVRMATCT